MALRKGFTLIQMVVVLIIVGTLAAIAFPKFVSFIEQIKAQTAQNNLLAIYAAQSKYNEDHSAYYYSPAQNTNDFNGINSALSLHMSTNNAFNYSCWFVGSTPPYECQAWDGTDTLTLNPNNAIVQPPQALITCTTTGSSNYCPSVQT